MVEEESHIKSARAYGIGSNEFPGLAKLVEETGELQQVLGKVMTLGHLGEHWDGSLLEDRLLEELGDVHAAIIFFINNNFDTTDAETVTARSQQKLDQFRYWHEVNQG